MKLLSHKVAAAESVAVARGPAPDPDSADDRPYAAAVLVVSSESRSWRGRRVINANWRVTSVGPAFMCGGGGEQHKSMIISRARSPHVI